MIFEKEFPLLGLPDVVIAADQSNPITYCENGNAITLRLDVNVNEEGLLFQTGILESNAECFGNFDAQYVPLNEDTGWVITGDSAGATAALPLKTTPSTEEFLYELNPDATVCLRATPELLPIPYALAVDGVGSSFKIPATCDESAVCDGGRRFCCCRETDCPVHPTFPCVVDLYMRCFLSNGQVCGNIEPRSTHCTETLRYDIRISNSGPLNLTIAAADFTFNNGLNDSLDSVPAFLRPFSSGNFAAYLDIDACSDANISATVAVNATTSDGDSCRAKAALEFITNPSLAPSLDPSLAPSLAPSMARTLYPSYSYDGLDGT